MTIARIVAITAVVCAAMGATTQADAAKRKPAGSVELDGCAYWVPLACTVMGSGPYVCALRHCDSGSVAHPDQGARPEDRQCRILLGHAGAGRFLEAQSKN